MSNSTTQTTNSQNNIEVELEVISNVTTEIAEAMDGFAADQARAYAEQAEAAAEAAKESQTAVEEGVAAAAASAAEAKEEADRTQGQADRASEEADRAAKAADTAEEYVQMIKGYDAVGTVNLDDYEEFSKIYVNADSENAPTNEEKFYVDTDTDTDGETVRQKATGVETGMIYIRYEKLPEKEEEPDPLTPASGTLAIVGGLTADLSINGNVAVDRELSGKITATGSITYESVADDAEIEENATLYECDISVDEGTLSIASTLLTANETLMTAGKMSNSGTSVLNVDLTIEIEDAEETALENTGTLTVNSDLHITSENEAPIVNEGTIDGYGTIYVNEEVYYDGGGEPEPEEEPDPEPEEEEPEGWGEWVVGGGGGGDIEYATDEEVEEKLQDIFGDTSGGGGSGSGGLEVASDEDVEKGLQDIFGISLNG